MIKRIVFLLLVMFANYAYGLDDVAGWKNTEWGMTCKEALKLFPDATDGNAEDGTKYLSVPNISISDMLLETTMHFDKHDKLDRVVLSLPMSENNEYHHTKLRQLLIEKYGAPTFANTENVGYGSYNTKTSWKFATTKIELNLLVMKRVSSYLLMLIYTPAREEANL